MPAAVEKNRLLSWKLNCIVHLIKPEIGLLADLGWTVEELHKCAAAVERSVKTSPRSVAELRPVRVWPGLFAEEPCQLPRCVCSDVLGLPGNHRHVCRACCSDSAALF